MVYLIVKYMIATRDYEILNTGTVDLLKNVTCIYSKGQRSPSSYCKCFVRMLPANQLLAHFTALLQ